MYIVSLRSLLHIQKSLKVINEKLATSKQFNTQKICQRNYFQIINSPEVLYPKLLQFSYQLLVFLGVYLQLLFSKT